MDDMIFQAGMGWIPDHPDIRDFTPETDVVSPKLQGLGQTESVKKMLKRVAAAPGTPPASTDLRPFFTPVEHQGSLGSCTANAGVALVEYFEKKAFGKYLDASRLFLYYNTRKLLGWTGDSGAYIRTTMKALVLFGVPPEEYWPYVVSRFDTEPSAFHYAFAQNYQAILYYKLDTPGLDRKALLLKIKTGLANGLPSMFGFTVYSSYTQAGTTGKIPYPVPGEGVAGGHAVVAAGYDDNMKIKNNNPGGIETRGALLIRNSWGTGWGDRGYGWLPYEYVLKSQAVDWWSLIRSEWVDTKNFG